MSKVKTITGSECDNGAPYIPSELEIKIECAKLQNKWSKSELHARTCVTSDAPVETVYFVATRPNARGPVLFH